MKVLHIETIYEKSGISKIAQSVIAKLEENGDEGMLAVGRLRIPIMPEDEKKVFHFGKMPQIVLDKALSLVFDDAGFNSHLATKRLLGFIDEYQPDIINLHSLLGYYINIEMLFDHLAKTNIPVVYTQHDCWAVTGHCIHFISTNCDKWKTGCSHCDCHGTYPESIFDFSRRNYEKKKRIFTSVKNMIVVAPSEWIASVIRESYLSDYPVKVIRNGINLKQYAPTGSDLRERYSIGNKTLLLSVASCWPEYKGLRYLCELSEMLDGSKYAMVVIGVSEKQIKSLPGGMIGIPRTTDFRELVKWYSTADLFLNPTLADTFPTVNIESLACGTPVITFPTGGSPEIADEKSGIVTKEKTAVSLLEAIKQWENDPFDRNDCIKRSKMYDSDARYAEYIDLYDSILSEAKNKKDV